MMLRLVNKKNIEIIVLGGDFNASEIFDNYKFHFRKLEAVAQNTLGTLGKAQGAADDGKRVLDAMDVA